VKLKKMSLDLPDFTYPISIVGYTITSLPIDIVAQSVGVISISINATNVTGNIPIDIKAQTVGNIGVDIKAQTLGTVNIAINAANVTGNIPIDIKAQTVGNIGIDIKAQTVGNVGVDIKAATATINIATSGGVNIIIDKLTQAAYLERRSTISNDNNVTTPTAPPDSMTGTTYRGKFFPRGIRGFIETLSVYCKRTAAGTITLSYSPQPGMGAINSVTITPGAAWDWKSANVRAFWNYDSMFIWISACSADVSWGRDATTPYDYLASTDSGVTWFTGDYRLYARIDLREQTIGDIPVSGIVNTIEIPSVVSARQEVVLSNIPASTAAYDTLQVGAGETLIVIFGANSDAAMEALKPRILCDGNLILPFDSTFESWAYVVTATSPGIALGVWDGTNHLYVLIVTIPYPFKRSLQVGFYNYHGSLAYTGWIAYVYKKIS